MNAAIRKIKLVAASVTNKLINPVSNALLSLIVIRHFGTVFWGEFVILLLLVNLVNQAISFGHRDYLLKEFGLKPGNSSLLWASNLTARSVLLLVSIIGLLLFSPYSLELNLWLSLWLIATFLNRAFDVIILIENRFKWAIIFESISAVLLIASALLFIQGLTILNLVVLIATTSFLKSLLFLFSYWRYFEKGIHLNIGLTGMKKSFGFFLPAIVGFTQNRIDIYLVALLMSQELLGAYQVLLSFMALTHNLIVFSVNPFVKNIYRMKDKVLTQFNRLTSLYGLAFSILSTSVIYLIMTYYYRIDFTVSIYLLALVQLIPFPNYLIRTYQLFKDNKQYVVVWVTIFLSLIYITLVYLLIPAFELSGALAANAINQWLTLIVLYFVVKQIKPKSFENG